MPSPRVQLITEIEKLEQLSGTWRELAHACACPAALPGWQLAWWRHLAPEVALLRAVAIFEQDRPVGLAPFFIDPGRRADYRLLGGLLDNGDAGHVARLVSGPVARSGAKVVMPALVLPGSPGQLHLAL